MSPRNVVIDVELVQIDETIFQFIPRKERVREKVDGNSWDEVGRPMFYIKDDYEPLPENE